MKWNDLLEDYLINFFGTIDRLGIPPPMLMLSARDALLEYLMTRPNRPLSHTMILEQVWGQHHDTLTNVVDVYICYLQNKVDRGYPKKLIHTVRDIGYKISE